MSTRKYYIPNSINGITRSFLTYSSQNHCGRHTSSSDIAGGFQNREKNISANFCIQIMCGKKI